MTPKKENSQLTPFSQTEFQEIVREKMRQAVRFTLITVLEAEMEAFIGAGPYQRTAQRRAYRNGSYQRSLTTSVGQIDDLDVPRTRQGFQTQLFERYQRRQAELDASICQMFVGGVSTSRVGEVIETLTGTKPSASTVSRVFHSVPLPVGAQVQSARLSLVKAGNAWNQWQFNWYAEASGNASTFSAATTPENRPRTTTSVVHDDNVNHLDGVRYSLDEIKTVVQEVINRPDWANGNALVILARADWAGWARKSWRTYNYSPANAAQLVITYAIPTPPPVPDFSGTPLTGTTPLTVTFTNSSTNASSYLWKFGNGVTSTVISPTYTYTQAGVYTVTLSASNGSVTNTLTRTSYITVYNPVVANFAATPLTGTAPLTVTFVNTSTGATDYLWDFGTGATLTVISPTYIYAQPGVYTVTLRASGPGISDTLTRTGYITVYEPVVADFSASPLTGTVPLTVTFSNSSTNATDYLWDFGDGSILAVTGTLTTPVISLTHLYTQTGNYTVTLVASNGPVTDTLTHPNYITVTAPITRVWQQLTTTISPPIIGEHSMAYDSNRNRLVLYGGNAIGWPYENTTWEFDGTDWITTTSTSPNARYGTAMAYDNVGQSMILFGGSNADDTALNETWQYTNTQWSLLSIVGTVPASRTYHSMIAGPDGVIYLFGGNNGETYYNDLWRYDNGTWNPVTVNGDSPPARTLAAVTYDPGNNRLLLFGGRSVIGTALSDFWSFDLDLSTWMPINTSGGPPGRMAHTLTYDVATGNVVLVGGVADDGDTMLGDTWHYQDQTGWTEVTALPPRAYHQAVYDDNAIILVSNGEVWRYE